MDLIVTHDSADFDALAAAVAAQKVYPEARISLGRAVGPEVRQFLALHKDRFPTVPLGEIDQEAVERLIIVDVRRKSRLAGVERVLERARSGRVEVHVYDHHASFDDDLRGAVEHVGDVGSATTLLIELIIARATSVDPVEATLFVLGIYADTGALTYAGTSPRDARAVAWLLEQGASLSAVNRYLKPPLSPVQREVLSEVLARTRIERIGGVRVGFIALCSERRCDGLAVVATAALELEDVAALFVIYEVVDRQVEVVGRSRSPLVDVGAVLEEIGGGGHRSAAAARVKNGTRDEVQNRVIAVLRKNPPRPRRVADVMSSPVRTVSPDMSLAAFEQELARFDQSGAPVMRHGRLIGIVSHRDVRRAADKGRADLPVSSHMSQNVIATTPSTPLEEALEAMEASDVGRLPVMDQDALVGIVTRSDILKILYDEK